MEVEWVVNHQYFKIYEKSVEVLPWLNARYEENMFIGYNRAYKRYVVQEIRVEGCTGPYEGFCYASRKNNEIKLVKKDGRTGDAFATQTFIWEPALKSWKIEARMVKDGKEGETVLEQKLVKVSN
jgi:hypothetical protein